MLSLLEGIQRLMSVMCMCVCVSVYTDSNPHQEQALILNMILLNDYDMWILLDSTIY